MFSINQCGQRLAAHLENHQGEEGGVWVVVGNSRFLLVQSVGGGSYGNAACPVWVMWKNDEVSLGCRAEPSQAKPRHKAGHKVPAKASFLGGKSGGFHAFQSRGAFELPARRGLSGARKPGSGLSLAEPGKLRLHGRNTVVQHRTAMSANKPPTRKRVG